VVIVGEQIGDASLLLVGEQVGAGEQGPAGGIQRVGLAAALAVEVQLDATMFRSKLFTTPSKLTRTLSGLTSRWTMPSGFPRLSWQRCA